MLSPRGSSKNNPKLEYVPIADKKDAGKTKLVLSKCVREVNFNLGLGVRFLFETANLFVQAISLPNKRLTSLEGLGVQKGLEVFMHSGNQYLRLTRNSTYKTTT